MSGVAAELKRFAAGAPGPTTPVTPDSAPAQIDRMAVYDALSGCPSPSSTRPCSLLTRPLGVWPRRASLLPDGHWM